MYSHVHEETSLGDDRVGRWRKGANGDFEIVGFAFEMGARVARDCGPSSKGRD